MYIKVRVNAGSKKEAVVERTATSFVVCVKEKPERNLANKRVVQLMAEKCGIPENKVRIIGGHHSPGKILSLEI